MPRNRATPEAQIITWFQVQPWDVVKVIYGLVTEIVRTRRPPASVTVPPNLGPLGQGPLGQQVAATGIGGDHE